MPKHSFRDLLNFKAVTPVDLVEPKSDSDKVIQVSENIEPESNSDKLNKVKDGILPTASSDTKYLAPEKDVNIEITGKRIHRKSKSKLYKVAPNDFTQKRITNTGKVVQSHLSQSEIDSMNNWWGLVNTSAYKKIKTFIDNTRNVSNLANKILGDGNTAYRFVKEITNDPLGNKWVKAVKNDREETLIAAVKNHIDAFKDDWQSLKIYGDNYKINGKLFDFSRRGGYEINMNKDAKEAGASYTYKDYTNTDKYYKEYNDIDQLYSLSMPLPSSEAKRWGKQVKDLISQDENGNIVNNATGSIGKKRGTLIFTKESIKNAILNTDDEVLGWNLREFALENELRESAKVRYSDGANYYKYISSPYNQVQNIKSPIDALNFAKSMGFCSGYKDVAGFSLDSSHLWGITIEPYEFPGYYTSLTPPLPKFLVPTWKLDPDGFFLGDESYVDYGKVPPVVSYNLSIGTSMEKDIGLTNGSTIKIPVGFSYNYALTLTLADDEHASIKNYMMYYYNTIFRPEEGLMAPYELCSFLITLTSFKPGLKVKSQLKLICVPVGYTVSQGGESAPSGEMVQIGFSVVGMRTNSNYNSIIDNTLGGIWGKLTWNDIIMRPVNNNPHTVPLSDWAKNDRTINRYYGGELKRFSNLPIEEDPILSTRVTNPDQDPYNLKNDKKLQRLMKKGKTEKAYTYARKKINKNS